MFSAAEAYERFMGRWSRRLARKFVEFVGVGDGDCVLDVGSGTGSLLLTILNQFATTRATAIDPAIEFVNFARAQAETAHAGRATFEQGDAQRLRFADVTFDKSLCALVLNFVSDRDAALREMIRVTRTDGVVAAAVWDYGQGMEMLRMFWEEAAALDAAAAGKDERHMPLCRAGELAAMWRANGLIEVEERPLVIAMEFSSFDDFWLPFLGGQGPAGAYASTLPKRRQQQLEERLRRRLLRDRDDGAIELRARAWAVKGVAATGIVP